MSQLISVERERSSQQSENGHWTELVSELLTHFSGGGKIAYFGIYFKEKKKKKAKKVAQILCSEVV